MLALTVSTANPTTFRVHSRATEYIYVMKVNITGKSGTDSSSVMQKAEKTKEEQPEQILPFIVDQGQCVTQRYLATVIPSGMM
jgi:alpha-tubulin suppressor-like RCC1 family protein